MRKRINYELEDFQMLTKVYLNWWGSAYDRKCFKLREYYKIRRK